MKKLITIGGEDRPILFNKHAFSEIEKICGKPFLRIEFTTYEFAIAMTYVGLKWGLYNPEKAEEPKPKFNMLKVGDWMDENFLEIASQVEAILVESMPKPKNVEAGSDPAK